MLNKPLLETILRQNNMERHDTTMPFFIVSTDKGAATWACRVDYDKQAHTMTVTEILNYSEVIKDENGNIVGESFDNTIQEMQRAAMLSCADVVEFLASNKSAGYTLRAYVQRYRENYFEWQVSTDGIDGEDTTLVILYN